MKNGFMVIIIVLLPIYSYTIENRIELPSSFNPVGSGSRALAMGGAFIGIANDATAASWNPGGLNILEKSELSIVFSDVRRYEHIKFATNPEGAGKNSINTDSINYMSFAYPFELYNRHISFAISYQYLFNFDRHWQFQINTTDQYHDQYSYLQTGKLTAIGFSFCVEIMPELSAGITLNIWDDQLSQNSWTQYIKRRMISNVSGNTLRQSLQTEKYTMKGINTTTGLLWQGKQLSIGFVLKSSFTGEIDHTYISYQSNTISQDRLKLPLSFGVGLSWMFSERFFISMDAYQTKWQDYIYISEENKQICPVSGLPVEESDIEPTNQIRFGAEYVYLIPEYQCAVPLRAGLFYDPVPDNNHPDDFYGGSFGFGLSFSQFSFDFAYQFRFGKDVNKTMIKARKFSEDIKEHSLYFSCIYYLN